MMKEFGKSKMKELKMYLCNRDVTKTSRHITEQNIIIRNNKIKLKKVSNQIGSARE